MSDFGLRKIMSGLFSDDWPAFLFVTTIGIALNIALHSHVRHALLSKYPNDSLYTLSAASVIGLVVITSTLLMLVLYLSWYFSASWIEQSLSGSIGSRVVYLFLNLIIVVAVYSLMLTVAPQIFYTYYQWVFTGLPVQWVIKPLSFDKLLHLVSLPSGASIADHLAGFALWVLLFNTVAQWVVGPRK